MNNKFINFLYRLLATIVAVFIMFFIPIYYNEAGLYNISIILACVIYVVIQL